jgi:hypothetical protein
VKPGRYARGAIPSHKYPPLRTRATMRTVSVFIAAVGLIASCGGTVSPTDVPPSSDAGPTHDGGATDASADVLVDAALADAPPPTLDASPCLVGGSVWHLDQDIGDNDTQDL